MLAGGAEAPVCLLGVGGFTAMRALATGFNDEPTRASRPFDGRREGFVVAAGVLWFFLPLVYAVGFWLFTSRDEAFPR